MAKQPNSTDEEEKLQRLYESRKESIREVIDTLAAHSRQELDEHGKKTEIANELGIAANRVHYVMDTWPELIEHRRNAMVNPLDTDAVKEAYEDEALKQMAGDAEMMADGLGNVEVPIQLKLDEIFRCMKLLPGDLGMKFFAQTMEHSDEIPREGIQRLFEHKDD